MQSVWPELDLTDYERKFVNIYKTRDKPGVLKRVYKIVLNYQAQPTKNLPVQKLSGQIQISRRSRIFGLTFSGNLGSWRLQITNVSGTTYTARDSRQQLDPLVAAMVPCNNNDAVALGGLTPPINIGSDHSDGIGPDIESNAAFNQSCQSFPLIIEPNWLLLPNETMVFNGTPIPVTLLNGKDSFDMPLILEIGIHVWEFPGMGV